MTTEKQKEIYNTIMAETDEKALCVQVDKPISEEGYMENFLPRFNKMIEEHGEARLLVYFKDYHGWMKEAAEKDIETVLRKGHKVKKLALVNPPPQEIKSLKIKEPLINGEHKVKFFAENELNDAIEWVKT